MLPCGKLQPPCWLGHLLTLAMQYDCEGLGSHPGGMADLYLPTERLDFPICNLHDVLGPKRPQ